MDGTPKSARGVPPPPPPAGLPRPPEAPEPASAKREEPGTEDGEGPSWRERRKHQLTADTLFELDAPTRAVTRDLDVEIETGLLESAANEATAEALNTAVGEVAAPAGAPAGLPAALLDTAALAAVAAATDETPEQQRSRRVTTRLLACRDCFRWLGSLGVSDDDRRSVSRLLLELDAVVGVHGKGTVIKDPEPALKDASSEQLEALDRLLGPIEDRLLTLDETVSPAEFQVQLENRKQSKKIVARYGRVLACRRLPAGQRRDRFELIATNLLTGEDDARRRILPPDRARVALEHLIGGLKRPNDEAAREAIEFLRESAARISQFASANEFFDSGFFIDVQGYKVSTRDQLLNPEYLYLSVLINVEIHNRLEAWIGELERAHDAKQLSALGTPREQIMRRLREQQDAVDESFGPSRRKSSTDGKRSDPTAQRSPSPQSPSPAKRAKASPSPPRARFTFDRQFAKLALSVLVILGSAGYVAWDAGLVGREPIQALNATQLHQFSPLLGRGRIRGTGGTRRLDAVLLRKLWLPLDARGRREQAEKLAHSLERRGIKRADVKNGSGVRVIAIDNGLVSYVEGGKL